MSNEKLTPYGETMSNGPHTEDPNLEPLESVGCVLVTSGENIGIS